MCLSVKALVFYPRSSLQKARPECHPSVWPIKSEEKHDKNFKTGLPISGTTWSIGPEFFFLNRSWNSSLFLLKWKCSTKAEKQTIKTSFNWGPCEMAPYDGSL